METPKVPEVTREMTVNMVKASNRKHFCCSLEFRVNCCDPVFLKAGSFLKKKGKSGDLSSYDVVQPQLEHSSHNFPLPEVAFPERPPSLKVRKEGVY